MCVNGERDDRGVFRGGPGGDEGGGVYGRERRDVTNEGGGGMDEGWVRGV